MGLFHLVLKVYFFRLQRKYKFVQLVKHFYLVLWQLPERKIDPNPKTNANPNPNSNPNRGGGDNIPRGDCPDTFVSSRFLFFSSFQKKNALAKRCTGVEVKKFSLFSIKVMVIIKFTKFKNMNPFAFYIFLLFLQRV